MSKPITTELETFFQHVEVDINDGYEREAARIAVQRLEGIDFAMTGWDNLTTHKEVAASYVGFPRIIPLAFPFGLISFHPREGGPLIDQLTFGVEDDAYGSPREKEIIAGGKRLAERVKNVTESKE